MGLEPMLTASEWGGALSGLLGAFLLATHSRLSRYGWLAFLAANSAMIAFAVGISAYGLLVQQIGFTCTSLLGIHRLGPTEAWSWDRYGVYAATLIACFTQAMPPLGRRDTASIRDKG